MASVKHKKIGTIADWNQADIDEQIALGNLPAGTTPADIQLTSDWNDEHDVIIEFVDITGSPGANSNLVNYLNSNYLSVTTAANEYIPYTGANKAINLNAQNVTMGGTLAFTNAVVVGDVTGNTRGARAIDIQTNHFSIPSRVASGDDSVCIGTANSAVGAFGYAFGLFNAVDAGAYAFGRFNTANPDAVTIGISNTSSNTYAIGIGYSNTTSGNSATTVGSTNTSSANSATCVGSVNTAAAQQATAVGGSNNVRGLESTGVGFTNLILGAASGGLGYKIKNLTANTTMVGNGLQGTLNVAELTLLNGRAGVKCENPQDDLHVAGGITAASDATLGAELVTNGSFTGSATGWTLGTGWAYGSNQANKNADGTGTLSQTTVVPVVGKMYKVTLDCVIATGFPQSGTFTVTLGGYTSEVQNLFLNVTKQIVLYVKATTTGSLVITPSNTSRFGIDNVSVKEVLAGDVTAYGNYYGKGFVELENIPQPAVPASGARIFSENLAGKSIVGQVDNNGSMYEFQPLLGRYKTRFFTGTCGTTAVYNTGLVVTANGAATSRTKAVTNLFTQTDRTGYNSTATINVSSGFRTGATVWRGNGAGLGGFFCVFRFGVAAFNSTESKLFVGLSATTGSIANTVVSTLLNTIGITCDYGAGQTTLYLTTNDGSGTATQTNLGANFPANTTNTDLYELVLYSAVNGSSIGYVVNRLNTSDTVSGTLTTDIPVSNQLLAAHFNLSTGSTLTTVTQLDVVGLTIGTEI